MNTDRFGSDVDITRPYSRRLALWCIPVTYVLFMVAFWAVPFLAAIGEPTSGLWQGLLVVSMWWLFTSYVWVVLLWVGASVVLAARNRRSATRI